MQGDPCTVDCETCGVPVETHLLKDNYYPRIIDCEFCRGEKQCGGHIVWRDGELDSFGRVKIENVSCPNMATIYDTEGQDFYCEDCWKKMNEPQEISEMEQFVVRAPED